MSDAHAQSKKHKKSPLDEDAVARFASALQLAIDAATFAIAAAPWAAFLQDANELHMVLLLWCEPLYHIDTWCM